MIVKEGNKWSLKRKDGSGTIANHKTKKKALAQERAIHANKKGR